MTEAYIKSCEEQAQRLMGYEDADAHAAGEMLGDLAKEVRWLQSQLSLCVSASQKLNADFDAATNGEAADAAAILNDWLDKP